MYLDPFKMDPVFGNNHPTSRLIMQSENNSYTDTLFQKQPPEILCKKMCSQKFRKIHMKTPVPESLFNKVADVRLATLLNKRLWHRLRQRFSFFKKHLQWLLLHFSQFNIIISSKYYSFTNLLIHYSGIRSIPEKWHV